VKEFRFYISRESGLPHIYDHGVNEHEIEEAFLNRVLDFRGRGDTRVAQGQTAAGRYLKFVYIPDEDSIGVFIITAYDLRGKGLRALKRRLRRRFHE